MTKTLVRRSALTTALAVLALAPAASAKGPGAFMSPTPAGIEPGPNGVPRAGRWSVTVLDGVPGGLRFRFPCFEIGGQPLRTSKAEVVFAEGSRPVPKRTTRGSDAISRGGDGALWIVPAGLALAPVLGSS